MKFVRPEGPQVSSPAREGVDQIPFEYLLSTEGATHGFRFMSTLRASLQYLDRFHDLTVMAISFRLFEARRHGFLKGRKRSLGPPKPVDEDSSLKLRKASFSPLLLVLGAAVLWSTGGLFIKATHLTAFELSFGRSLLAAITVAVFTRREGFGINRVSALAAVLYALLLILFVMATKLTTAANAIFLQYSAPVYLLILEPLLYKEKFRLRDLITVAICIGGMSLFFVGKLKPQDVSGNLLALGSGVCFALYFLLLRHSKSRNVNRASSVIYGNLIVALICAPAFFAAEQRGINPADFARVSYLGVIQIGFPYLLLTLAMARGLRSLDAGIIGYIEPVLNPVWVFLFLGERPLIWSLLGGVIIITSVAFHMLMEVRHKRKHSELIIVSPSVVAPDSN